METLGNVSISCPWGCIIAALMCNPWKDNRNIFHTRGQTNYTTPYDFTVGDGSQFYPGDGQGAKEIEPGIWGMIAGDGNANGSITASDNNSVWLPQFLAGEDGYKSGDYNLNGSVTASDNNSAWLINFLLGADSQVP